MERKNKKKEIVNKIRVEDEEGLTVSYDIDEFKEKFPHLVSEITGKTKFVKIESVEKTDVDEPEEIIELKKIPKDKAIELIKSYVEKHPACRTSDIIYDLELDPDLVLDCLNELEKEKKIRGKEIDT